MKDLTLIIPSKRESESLPIFLKELKKYKCKKKIVLQKNDFKTINSLKKFKEVEIFKQKGGLDFASWDMYRRLTDKSYVDKNGLPLYIDDGMIEIAFAYTTEKEHQVQAVIGGRGVSGMAAPARREWCKMIVINYQRRLREEELALT